MRLIRIVIVYVTAGTGHRRAAEALAAAVHRRAPDAVISCVDLLDYTPRFLRRGYPGVYGWLVRHMPACWGFGYRLLDWAPIFTLIQPWRRLWNLLMARRFVNWLVAEQPDFVIATHFFPADLFTDGKRTGWLQAKAIVVITDLFPHRLWLGRSVDRFVAGSEKTKEVCVQRGIPPERVRACGIPVHERFRRASGSNAGRLHEFGLDASRQTVLVTGGGIGLGPIKELVAALIALERTRPSRLQLLVVCGENATLYQQLSELTRGAPMPMTLFGFVETMPELMAASDLLVTKAGGMTVTEAMVVGLPIVFLGVLPGQEELNLHSTVASGAGVQARRPEEAAALVRDLLDDPARLSAMRARAAALGRPTAADDIIQWVLSDGTA